MGRIVKVSGDGILVEFASAVDAVRNALAIQDAMAGRNADLPEDSRLTFRVGINVGDVIIEGDDIHGDGVNLAARLEGLCRPGEVYISGTVHDQVAGKLTAGFDDLGDQMVKNISKPLRVYRVRPNSEGTTVPDDAADAPSLPDKPSIAVLPFDNMSGDAEQEYFSDGITEDNITDLSKVSALFVIARNSSFSYKGKSPDVKNVARELGIRYVLEGSVRKAANRVRVTAQLVDGATGGHLWAERYDRDLDDIFTIQDEITLNIVEALKVTLDLDEQARIGSPSTASIEAYDFALRGRELLYRYTPKYYSEAAAMFEKSIALDPNYIPPYWGLAIVLFTTYLNDWDDATVELLERGRRLALTAIEIDPTDPQGHWALALANLWMQDLDGAIEASELAVALGPSNAEAFAIRGYILSYASRPIDAIESLEIAMRLNPRHSNIWLHFLAHAHFIEGNFERAASLLERRIRLNPETDISRVLLASCYGHLGRTGEARDEWARVLEINPDYSIEQKSRVLPYKNPADWERFIEGLREAGVREE